MMLQTLSLAAATFALVAVVPAQAQDSRTVVHVQATVNYADLDISREAGAQALLDRIKTTAEKLCHPAIDGNDGRYLPYQACLQDAVGNAVAAVHSPLVSSLYGGPRQTVTVAQSN